jgi:hypothetical protein
MKNAAFCTEKQSNLPPHWVLIVDWPDLDRIYYLVKVTRTLNKSTIVRQLGEHALCCPQYMDKVLYSLGNKTLGYDAEYCFFLQTILAFLKSSDLFKIAAGMSFEDFMVKEYCIHLINRFFSYNAITFKSKCTKENFRRAVLLDFMRKWNKQKENELYLKISFAEDIIWL